ncbi:hypothetical protein B0H19DRAFT_1114688 [Mycena capillaripes]|nr:hypothetical protein B0H19DRAFT_1114688 [Mycena capillaripes]
MEPTIDLYRQLPAAKAALVKLKLTAADPFMPKYVRSIVTQASNTAEIYATRDSRMRKEQKAKKAEIGEAEESIKIGMLGRRQGTTRELGLWGFDESQAKYTFALFLPLHHLWMGYMSELLNLPQLSSGPPRALSGAVMHPKLLKADFHGSIMTVSQSQNTAILRISGIVIHETEGTFKVITKKKKKRVFLSKQISIFTFAIPVYSTLPAMPDASAPLPIPESRKGLQTVLDGAHVRLELYRNHFCFRSADRAGRKFKAKETIEL